MEKSSKVYVGIDVHKESIEVPLAEPGGEVRRLGQFGGALRVPDPPRTRGAGRALHGGLPRAGTQTRRGPCED